MESLVYNPIGIIYSDFKESKGTPIQAKAAKGIKGKIEIFKEYEEGLKDIDGFSHIILIYHFHMSKKASLKAKPFLDNEEHGVFATRVPSRPNSIGLSVVKLEKVENNILHIENVDILDKTPILDIKPYVPNFDIHEADKIGWFNKNINNMNHVKDDGRFIK